MSAVVVLDTEALSDARHADLNRLARDADEHPPLRDRGRSVADAAAGVRTRIGTDVAVVDALVGAVAAEVAAGIVEVITAGTDDLAAVVDALDAPVDIVAV